ncbi:MAG: FAD-linked oxidase C-terminal domain-containing protein [Pirellulales bacterium]
MDPERERIQADLRGILEGEVHCDDLHLQMYASDASIFHIKPLGIVRPRRTKDVVACVQYAAENQIPVHARGAGTGVSGESLGRGLIIDFAHFMRRIVETGEDWVRVQPGVVLANLNRHIASSGRIFGPDPATRSVTTMGSVLSINTTGSHWLLHGSARDHIMSLQVVLANGEVTTFQPTPITELKEQESVEHFRIASGMVDLIKKNGHLIQQHTPQTLVNNSGYHLNDVVSDTHIDLCKLLAGSEGTLGLITEAKLRTSPKVAHRGLVLLFFEKLENAAQAALEIPGMGASACDLLDRRLLSIARETDRRYTKLLPSEAEAMLLVEVPGNAPGEVRDRLRAIVELIRRKKRLAFHSIMTTSDEEVGTYWELSRKMIPILYRLKGSTRPVPFVEDIVVPPHQMPDFLKTLQNCLKKHQVTASIFAHAGHGQLEVRPFLNIADENDLKRLQELAADLYEETLKVGGSISGEHADGLSRTPYLQKQYGNLFGVFERTKKLFDPQGIFNPGKKITAPSLPLIDLVRKVDIASAQAPMALSDVENEKPADPKRATLGTEGLALAWNHEELAAASRNCNGCGKCRTFGEDMRMCPIFRFDPHEESSPRAKANLMRGISTQQIPLESLSSDALKEITDLCVNCHQCRIDCPSNVDIPKMMVESKSQYAATNGLSVSDSFLAKLDRWAVWGNFFLPMTNWALANRQSRWLFEKLFGIAQGRKLPRFAKRPFLKMAQRKKLTKPTRRSGKKVLYFVDLYANWFDVQLAETFVAIMEHNGVSVYVHPSQQPSGMQAYTLGAVPLAKSMAKKNIAILSEAIRQGYEIVTTEPAAALCLTHEYLNMFDTEEAHLVAANTTDACEYIWKLHQVGELELDFKPVNALVGFHTPCHTRAMHGKSAGESLLRLIPGLSVQSLEKGCSGMAGTFGLKKENYRSSLRAGWNLITALRDVQIQVGSTECSACKIQMEQGANKATVHPLKLLALSYGLMPELSDILTTRTEDLVVT